MRLIQDARREYNWGGDEGSEGSLHPGHVDLDELVDNVAACFDEEGIDESAEEHKENLRSRR